MLVGLGLLVTLQLAAALRVSGPGAVTCDAGLCKCEGREFGPGKTGDFVHDDQTQDGEYDKNIKSFWDFNAVYHGKEVPMASFKSKLALVVNVASA